PHFAPKAKAIIYLHMNGGPAQLETWDYKPKLGEFFDKDLPDSIRNGQRITTMTSGQARVPVAPSMFQFERHGNCCSWSSGLLPGKYSGVALRHVGDPVLYVQNPPGVSSSSRRAMLDALGELNRRQFETLHDPETQTRIAQYEMAFRMQSSVPELTNIK